jgi:hypothetical protein
MREMSPRKCKSVLDYGPFWLYYPLCSVINSVCLSDLNGDWTAEIVTGGAYHDGTRWNAQLAVWGMRQTV